jgi:hypothetical protein
MEEISKRYLHYVSDMKEKLRICESPPAWLYQNYLLV